jgi:outer membrane lipoprotein carrier protein
MIRASLMTTLAALFVWTASPQNAAAQEKDRIPPKVAAAQGIDAELHKVVASVERYYADQENFSATFDQEVARQHLPDRPIKKSGRVYFKKPGKMRWDYEEPDKVYYISDGKVLWNYVPESKLAYRLDVQDSELFYALKFLWGKGSLVNDFNVSDGGKDGTRQVLVIKPKTAEHNFQQLRFFVSEKGSTIEETELTDPAGNVSRLIFKEVSHKELPEKGFQFEPPADVQVEDLSAPVAPTQ